MRTTRMDPDTAARVQALVADVDALAHVAVSGLSVDALAELVGALSTATSRLRGITGRALGEADERGGGLLLLDRHADLPHADLPHAQPDEVPVATTTWLRHTAHLSVGRAGSQVRTARALRELPRVTDAVVAGVITAEHAGVLARLVGKLETADLVDGQDELIEMAGRTDPEGLSHYVAHLIATWCEPDLDEAERKAEARRYLQLSNRHDGSWSGRFCLPDAAMETIKTVLEPLARPAGLADARGAGQPVPDSQCRRAGRRLHGGGQPRRPARGRGATAERDLRGAGGLGDRQPATTVSTEPGSRRSREPRLHSDARLHLDARVRGS